MMSLDPTDADIGVDPSEYDEEPPTFLRAESLVTKPVEVMIMDDWDIDF